MWGVWRSVILAAVAATSAGLIWLVLPRDQRSAVPPTVDYPEEVDLGPRPYGEIAQGSFRLHNRGGSLLVMSKFTTSCSCAGVEVERNGTPERVQELSILPGQYADLNVRISVGARQGTAQTVYVSFQTNDPVRPAATIATVIPRVTGGFYAEPVAFVFGTLPVGRAASKTIRLYDTNDLNRRVRQVRSLQPERFTARLVPFNEENGPVMHESAGRLVAIIEVVPRVDGPLKLDGAVEVVSVDESRPPDHLPVLGEVVPEVIARPSALTLPHNVGGSIAHTSQVALIGRDSAISLVVIEHLPDGVTAAIRPDPDNPGQWLIDVAARPAQAMRRTTSIRLRATLQPGTMSAVEIPVVIFPEAP